MISREVGAGFWVGERYDTEMKAFVGDDSFSWRFIERPGFDRYIPEYYHSNSRVLDLGCGAGRVIKYLISKGVAPENIVGIDASEKLLAEARKSLPGVQLIHGLISEMDVPSKSFDLVTSNMVFHYIDDDELGRALDKIYEALKPNGVLFFVDTDPDHNEESRRPENVKKWLWQVTPWGEEMPIFNRDPCELLLDVVYYHGFDLKAGWPLKVVDEGRVEPEEYCRYYGRPSRMAVKLVKVSKEERVRRRNWEQDPSRRIPSLVEL